MFVKKPGFLAFVVVLFVLAFHRGAYAQDAGAKQNSEAASPWRVKCSGHAQLVCKATFTLLLRKTRRLLLRLSINKTQKGTAGMLVQTPVGPYLPAGVSLVLEKVPLKTAVFHTCDLKGCYAGIPLSAKHIRAMQSGAAMKIAFQNLKRKKIEIKVPLRGFTTAYKQLK